MVQGERKSLPPSTLTKTVPSPAAGNVLLHAAPALSVERCRPRAEGHPAVVQQEEEDLQRGIFTSRERLELLLAASVSSDIRSETLCWVFLDRKSVV